MTRAYVAMPLVVGTRIALPADVAGHLLRVMRLAIGDGCVLFNGDGRDVTARVVAADRRGAEVALLAEATVDTESPLRLGLLQGIARGEKMDLILQKATELGVHGIAPVSSDRSEVRLDVERAAKRLAHWRSVVAAACGQCGRARLPDVAAPVALEAALRALPAGTQRLLLDPAATEAVADLSPPGAEGILLAVGPEGGWSPRDRMLLDGAGFGAVHLGPRILRTETAGLAAIAALQSHFGDLR